MSSHNASETILDEKPAMGHWVKPLGEKCWKPVSRLHKGVSRQFLNSDQLKDSPIHPKHMLKHRESIPSLETLRLSGWDFELIEERCDIEIWSLGRNLRNPCKPPQVESKNRVQKNREFSRLNSHETARIFGILMRFSWFVTPESSHIFTR